MCFYQKQATASTRKTNSYPGHRASLVDQELWLFTWTACNPVTYLYREGAARPSLQARNEPQRN